nr:ATP-dependent RNA helicase [Seculamonas ecuadoriensis]
MQNADSRIPVSLRNEYLVCHTEDKLAALVTMLDKNRNCKCIVYMLTCACVDYFGKLLPELPQLKGINMLSLHGQMVAKKRTGTYERFVALHECVLICTDLAARGLDIPEVDLVIQFDAPSDPSMFVHRIGRTARMGRSGRALALLAPHEESYVEYLRLSNVPLVQTSLEFLQPFAYEAAPAAAGASSAAEVNTERSAPAVIAHPSENATAAALRKKLFDRIRSAAVSDRDVFERAQRAFVSYVRAYREHKLSFVFPFKQLDLGCLAALFALVTMPRMSDIKTSKSSSSFTNMRDVELASIPYKDKVREKARQERLKKLEEEKKLAEANAPAKAAPQPKHPKREEMSRRDRIRRKRDAQARDADDFDHDYKLMKKLQKGKISKSDFESELFDLTHVRDRAQEHSDASDFSDADSDEDAPPKKRAKPTSAFKPRTGKNRKAPPLFGRKRP